MASLAIAVSNHSPAPGWRATIGGGTLPCPINNFSYEQPAFDTFDLSLGYSTGTIPANTYLQNIALQLTVINLLRRHAAFDYDPSSTTRNPAGFDIRRRISDALSG